MKTSGAEEKLVLNSVDIPIVLLDNKLKIIQSNRAFIDMFHGLSALLERPIDSALGDDKNCFKGACYKELIELLGVNFKDTAIAEALESDKVSLASLRQFGNSYYRVIIKKLTETHSGGKYLITLIDATKEQTKSDFISLMSHEIRTPLNVIIGFAELMRENDLSSGTIKEYTSHISFAALSLLDLINDVLDFTKLNSNRASIFNEKCDVGKLCVEMLSMFSMQAREKGLKEIVDIESMPILSIDKRGFKQVIFNLMGNALKFTSEGCLELKAFFTKKNENFGKLTFYVKDSGIGIPQDEHSHIFELYVQSRATRGSFAENNGTGLGLPICKMILEKMGGTISLDSELGKGSKFTVEIDNLEYFNESIIPVENVQCTIKRPDLSGLTVLIVDDVKLNLKVLQSMIKLYGANVLASGNPEEAVELFKQNKVDIVLTDLWMPNINGADFAKQIRAICDTVKIIAVTADVESYANFDISVFDSILLKPVTKEKLVKILTRFSH